MEETEVAVKLEAHEHEIGSLNHRIEELERQGKSFQELVISINRMAINIENMLKELNRQEERQLRLWRRQRPRLLVRRQSWMK